MGGFQHVYLSGQCGQIILLALAAHCPPHCTALPSNTIAHSQVICEFASFVAEFISLASSVAEFILLRHGANPRNPPRAAATQPPAAEDARRGTRPPLRIQVQCCSEPTHDHAAS